MEETLRELKSKLNPGDREVVGGILSRIGDKWSVMALVILSKKPRRFTELLDTIPGISRRMLTVTLRQLERDGLIERRVHADVPPWFDYAVTDLGLSLHTPITAFFEWAIAHRDDIIAHRENYDSSQTSSVR